ncbi:MAG: hypothetical protein COT85_06175 [Chlamydiae bacterium CG10_big_fil_rev_8_21_14_0_10_42_34]|nr:MAG: hypothetical protein COT85_06175 [Chlamydiae bacterium CG10_big_fil_rev_8_21_14_0_10_42_34]
MRWLILFFLPLTLLAVINPEGRPSKAPFISGDAFRAISDYCYDEVDQSLNPFSIEEKSTIFVKTDLLGEFFSKIHPLINVSYILITHNSDDPTPGIFFPLLDEDKLIAWFGQNYDGFPHPKMIPIPMGIANFCWSHGNADLIKRVKDKYLKKTHLAHMQFSVETFAEERYAVFKKFSKASYCYSPPKKAFYKYLGDLASSKFEISPRGHALDTHRIWESLYLDVIPIVKTSSLNSLYEDLPILVIEDWNQVNKSFLKHKYKEFQTKSFSMEKIYMNYWIKLIDSYKNL